MAVVVKNTFLDVAGHTFLNIDEPCGADRRCRSVPRDWKPVAPVKTKLSLSKVIPSDASTQASPRSDYSRSSSASSPSSPRQLAEQSVNQIPFCFAAGGIGTEMDQISCRLARCHCELGHAEADLTHRCEGTGGNTTSSSRSREEDQPETLMDAESEAQALGTRASLNSDAPAFQLAAKATRIEAIANAINLALSSCGQIRHVNVSMGLVGSSSTLISAELQHASRAYDVVHLARQALDAVVARLGTVSLLSARVQKEECGYSLRSSVACLPDGARDSMCWDMFKRGSCPRRSECRWYHPQDGDIAKIKVSIRRKKEVNEVRSEQQFASRSSVHRHKILLGELVQ